MTAAAAHSEQREEEVEGDADEAVAEVANAAEAVEATLAPRMSDVAFEGAAVARMARPKELETAAAPDVLVQPYADFQELKEEFTLKNQSLGFKNQVISKLSKRFRDPSWLGTVWHCSTSLYLGSWGL
ncbi:unnamed protein product [Closterium sp. NIES-53]